jgi:transposase
MTTTCDAREDAGDRLGGDAGAQRNGGAASVCSRRGNRREQLSRSERVLRQCRFVAAGEENGCDDQSYGTREPPAGFDQSRIDTGSIPKDIWPAIAASSRPTPTAAIASSMCPGRRPGAIMEAACWVHAPRPFFVMADLAENARRKAQGKKPGVISPLALELVRRINALFEIERAINGQSADRRKAVPEELSAPLVADLEAWMREQRAKLSRRNDVAKAMAYMLKRSAFTRFLDDGRICLSNNAAERGVRGIALGRKSWLFCGSDLGGERCDHVQADRHGQDERR